MTEGIWTNGKTTLSGRWRYIWATGVFVIEINNRAKRIVTHNDEPIWGRYRLLTND